MNELRKGHIHRIVETLGMGYIAEPESDSVWPFLFSQLRGYSGQDLDQAGVVAKVPVVFRLEDGAIVEVIAEKALAHSGGN